jgi:hypothetical protein
MITDYTTLKEGIADWINLPTLPVPIPTLIRMSEAECNRVVRHPDMVRRATTELEDNRVEQPYGWLEAIRVDVSGVRLHYCPPADILDLAGAGPATHYTFINGEIEVAPTPPVGSVITQVFYCSIPPLGDKRATNWLLDKAPDVYLYGALMHAAPYLKEDERAPLWASAFDRAVKQLNASAETGRTSGGPLVRPIRGF